MCVHLPLISRKPGDGRARRVRGAGGPHQGAHRGVRHISGLSLLCCYSLLLVVVVVVVAVVVYEYDYDYEHVYDYVYVFVYYH